MTAASEAPQKVEGNADVNVRVEGGRRGSAGTQRLFRKVLVDRYRADGARRVIGAAAIDGGGREE